MIEALTWFEVNKKRLAIGFVALLVIGFGVYVVNYMSDQKEKKASSALIALNPATASTNDPPVPATAYLKVTEDYAGTAGAERALLLAASAYFTEGKYSEAQNTFNRLLTEKPGSKWAPDAAFGVAASLESQGKRDEALSAYDLVARQYKTSAVADEARLAMARIYEAKNQPGDALKQYEELTQGGMSMRAQDAMMRRMELLRKHPELEKPLTNAPALSGLPMSAMTNRPTTNALAASTNVSAATNRPAAATNTAPAPK
jgi:predicted negative regulator of RcsB-dependent stress response